MNFNDEFNLLEQNWTYDRELDFSENKNYSKLPQIQSKSIKLQYFTQMEREQQQKINKKYYNFDQPENECEIYLFQYGLQKYQKDFNEKKLLAQPFDQQEVNLEELHDIYNNESTACEDVQQATENKQQQQQQQQQQLQQAQQQQEIQNEEINEDSYTPILSQQQQQQDENQQIQNEQQLEQEDEEDEEEDYEEDYEEEENQKIEETVNQKQYLEVQQDSNIEQQVIEQQSSDPIIDSLEQNISSEQVMKGQAFQTHHFNMQQQQQNCIVSNPNKSQTSLEQIDYEDDQQQSSQLISESLPTSTQKELIEQQQQQDSTQYEPSIFSYSEESYEESTEEDYIPPNASNKASKKNKSKKLQTKKKQNNKKQSNKILKQQQNTKLSDKQQLEADKISEKKIKKRDITLNYKNKRSSEETKNLPTTIGKILLKSLKQKLPHIPELQNIKAISNKDHFQQLFLIGKEVQDYSLHFLTKGPMMAYLASSTRLKQKRLVIKYIDIIVEGVIDPTNFKCFKQTGY